MKSVTEMVKSHANTIYYQRRFGTATFPARPPIEQPPREIHQKKAVYMSGSSSTSIPEKLKVQLDDPANSRSTRTSQKHFNRSREIFYHAESLPELPAR